ncbi:MAG: LLM class flavin-dependent oxidoreductase [Myxococcota bacterium]|nr:LLM class flavin-dependent oxidoreductase [Myxococcota bacterium]
MPTPVSVLDLSPVLSGGTAGEALRNSLDLARHAEALGLRRYWVAEHHNAGSLACPAPEILIGQIAAITESIRVGSGGIMLPNHTPLKVAETFRVLHALFPGRIDLGVGRAPGTDSRTAAELRRSRDAVAVDDFPERFDDLTRYLDDDEPPRDRFTGTVRAIPLHVPAPELWMLGSSEAGGCLLAAQRGLGFAFAHHINPEDSARVLRRYRQLFVPSAHRHHPWAILAVAVVCAETDAEARELARSGELAMVRFLQGIRDRPLPNVEEARAHVFDAHEEALRGGRGEHVVVGGVERVRARLRQLAAHAQADEVMVLTHVHDHLARKRSYELVAGALRREE